MRNWLSHLETFWYYTSAEFVGVQYVYLEEIGRGECAGDCVIADLRVCYSGLWDQHRSWRLLGVSLHRGRWFAEGRRYVHLCCSQLDNHAQSRWDATLRLHRRHGQPSGAVAFPPRPERQLHGNRRVLPEPRHHRRWLGLLDSVRNLYQCKWQSEYARKHIRTQSECGEWRSGFHIRIRFQSSAGVGRFLLEGWQRQHKWLHGF